MFPDAHSHYSGKGVCLNVEYHDYESLGRFKYTQNISYSAHPWLADKFNFCEFVRVLDLINSRKDLRLLAFGEIGLDRIKGGDFKQQQDVFDTIAKFISKSHFPVIVHCVKSFHAVSKVLTKYDLNNRSLFHDFYGSREELEILISAGNYIGVGSCLSRPGSRVYKLIKELPLDRILLESDDTGHSIEVIYDQFSKVMGIPLGAVRSQMARNFTEFFEVSHLSL